MMMTLQEAQACVPAARLVGAGGLAVARVHTDTRTLQAGDLFVALKGERFDAHAFLPQARAAGAVAAMAEHGLDEAGLPGLLVTDSLHALQQLAQAWRQRWAGGPLIAVTGSNGKTTVTQMLAAILRAAFGDAALATVGNLNNHIGVPLTLLRLRPLHQAAVLELGMNHPGEIARLATIALPTVALVNNAQREHQEFMSSVQAVAVENGASIEALPLDGTAVFPADDPQSAVWQAQAGARRCLRFALADEAGEGANGVAEVTGQAWPDGSGGWRLSVSTPDGPAAIALQAPGRHNVRNALAACAAALAAGIRLSDVVQGLQAFQPVKGRSQIEHLRWAGRSLVLVDDSYNANPDSVLAAIEVLAGLPAPQWLILGDMGEVGEQGPAFHAEVGRRARERGLPHLWCAGALCREAAQAFGPTARHFADTEALLAALHATGAADARPPAGAVLVKGSRFMAMERVVTALRAQAGGPQGRAA